MLKHLRIRRPLVFVDVETTGVDPRHDRIVEIAMMRFAPGVDPRTLELRFNPERPIPVPASAVHGICDEHVAQCPTFSERAAKVARFIGDADLAGFGVARFDLPFLAAEFQRAGWDFVLRGRKVVDALTLFHRRKPRELTAAVRLYCHRDHTRAHRAGHDVEASVAVLDAMLGKYKDAPRGVTELHDHLIEVDVEGWFRREGAVIVFARGKHRDVSLEDVARRDPSYLTWLADKVMPDARRLIEKTLFHRAAGLPDARQALREAFRSLEEPGADPTELCVAVLRLSVERFAWYGQADLDADVALDDLADDAALDALAEYLWASRHAGPVAGGPQP